MQRKILFIPAFLIFLLVVVLLFIDFSKYATPYLADAQKTIGRTIQIGSVKLQILPTPRINIHDVSLGNVANAKKSEMATIKNVEVILSLIDLIKGKIVVKSINLKTPEITLEKDKDGHGNWELSFSKNESQEKEASQPTNNAATTSITVNHFEAHNATITYIDHKDGSTKNFSNLKIECDSEKLTGPYKIFIVSDTTENSIDLEILTGDFSSGETSLMAGISLVLQDHRVRAELKGTVDLNKKHLSGKLTASSSDFPFILELPNHKIDLHKAIDIQADLHTTLEHVTIGNLQATHPSIQLIGTVRYNLLTQLCDIDLKFKHQHDLIDLECSTKDFRKIEYHLTSQRYQEILKWFTKDAPIKQPLDIKGVLEMGDNTFNSKKTILSLGTAKADANIEFNTETKNVKIAANLNDIQQWGKTLGHDLPVSGPITITAKIAHEKDHLGLNTKISLAHGNIFFDGMLGSGELITKGNIRVEQVALSDYIINLKSDILLKKTEADLNIQSIGLKSKSGLDVFAGGKLLIDLSKEKPHIAGSLTAQPIQLTKYQDTSVQVLRALYIPQISNYELLKTANTRWSSSPTNLPLKAFTMNLHINIPKIALSGLTFEALQSDITLKDGKLDIPFSAHLYGGKISGSLSAQSSNTQNLGFSAQFSNISIAKIQAAAAHFSQGEASGSITLKTQGNSQYDWVSNLSGQAKFSINNGIIKGFDLQSIVNILKNPGNLFDLTAIQNFFNGRGTTAFSNASGDFTIANGITSTKNLIVETSEAHLKAEGQADLVNWQMRFNGKVAIPTLKNIPPLEFTIKGPLDEPAYNLNLKSLQGLLGKGAGDLVSKAIPGIDQLIPGLGKKSKNSRQPAEDSGTEERKPSAQPEKIVKGLLKNIFK